MTSPVDTPRHSLWSRLYHGETNLNIVGRWRLWFALSGAIILIGVVALVGRGLNFGIDFTGGTVWEVPAGDAEVAEVEEAIRNLGYEDVKVQEVTAATGSGDDAVLRVQAEAAASPARATTRALEQADDDLAALADDVRGGSRARVQSVRNSLDGIEGPFEQDIPAELESLQAQIDQLGDELPEADDATQLVADSTDAMLDDVDALAELEQAERERLGLEVTEELAARTGSDVADVAVDTIGPSWGEQISEKARTALIVFLIVIALYITLRFEFRMAVATLAALVHDLLVVIGVYAVFQFPVTPATVIAVLTILGFSIYDGIVVFDRVDENTKLLGRKNRLTYTDMANLSLNQVLMRSLNTSITALLPILTVLVLGSFVLGATTLEEFGLALFVGLLSGAYSSLFIATPMLALLKEREPRYQELRAKYAGTGAGGSADLAEGSGERVAAAQGAGSSSAAAVTPRPRKQGRTR